MHPTEVPLEAIIPLVPDAASVPGALAASLVTEISRLATLQAGSELLLSKNAQCTFIYYDWVEAIARSLRCPPSALPDSVWQLLDQSLNNLMLQTSQLSNAIVLSPGADSPGFLLVVDHRQSSASIAAHSTLEVANTIYHFFGLADRTLPPGLGREDRPLSDLPHKSARRSVRHPTDRDVARLASFGLAPLRPGPELDRERLFAEAAGMLTTDPIRALELVKTISGEPQSLAVLGIEAAAYVAIGDREKLLDVAARIASLDEDHPWRHLALGAFHALGLNVAEARPHLERVAMEGSSDDVARAGTIWLMLKRNSEAARAFRKVLAQSPWHMGSLLGLLSSDAVRGLEAERILRRILTLDPHHKSARLALNEQLISLGRPREVPN